MKAFLGKGKKTPEPFPEPFTTALNRYLTPGNFFMLSQGKKREKEEKKGRKRREEREEKKRERKERREEGGKREEEGQDSCDEESFRRIKC